MRLGVLHDCMTAGFQQDRMTGTVNVMSEIHQTGGQIQYLTYTRPHDHTTGHDYHAIDCYRTTRPRDLNVTITGARGNRKENAGLLTGVMRCHGSRVWSVP